MNPRIARVNALLQEALADILRKYHREEAAGITLTRVICSGDLQRATVYVGLGGGEVEQQQALRWLQKKKSELRRRLGREVVLKFLPELHFALDDSQLQELRIASLLAEIATETAPDTPAV